MAARYLRSGASRVDDEDEEMKPMPVQHGYDEKSTSFCVAHAPCNSKKWLVVCFVVLTIVAAVVVLIPEVVGATENSRSGNDFSALKKSSLATYQCPETVVTPLNYDEEAYQEDYIGKKAGEGSALLHKNITKFLETFRSVKFDGWGRTYTDVKKGLYHWKSTMYPDNVANGDSIYESACGIGLNLYMTLEILNEVKGIDRLVVSGNEYMDENAKNADTLFQKGAPFNSTKGTFCTADSAHLDFVPSNLFDLVFTGYSPPLNNPLQFDEGDFSSNYKLHKKLCQGDDWKSKKLADLAQQRQNDFTALVVGEMIRIAKPGKAVIVEQVAYPLCKFCHDWGGVAKSYWKESIDHYGWDIDPDSIVIEDDNIFNRYHVFMRKNAA